MKIKSMLAILSTGIFFMACKKGVEPVDGSRATVELRGGAKEYITGDITVNPNDSIFFDFTITSSEDMGFVGVQKNPVNQTAFIRRDTLNASNKNSYSTIMKFRADSANGSYVYRIAAHTNKGVYIGHKDVVITTAPDFNYYTNRFLYAPDTTGKNNKCYISVTDGGKTYSYNEGSAVSASIDFGYYYDTSRTGTTVNGHTLYALTANQFAPYDVTSWTKNATILKRATVSPTTAFLNIFSAGTIRTLCNAQLASGASNKAMNIAGSNPSNLVYFRTASGKNGIALLNFFNGGNAEKTSYINIDVKIEK